MPDTAFLTEVTVELRESVRGLTVSLDQARESLEKDRALRRRQTWLLAVAVAGALLVGGLAIHTALKVERQQSTTESLDCVRSREFRKDLHRGLGTFVDYLVSIASRPDAVERGDDLKELLREEIPAVECPR